LKHNLIPAQRASLETRDGVIKQIKQKERRITMKKRATMIVTDSSGRRFRHTPISYKVFGITYYTTKSVEIKAKGKNK
jgi:hypothetical protein